MIPKIEVDEKLGYVLFWEGRKMYSSSWANIVNSLKLIATNRYVPIYTQATHWLNPNNKYFPILTPDGGVLTATSVSDAQRFADELNALLDELEQFKPSV